MDTPHICQYACVECSKRLNLKQLLLTLPAELNRDIALYVHVKPQQARCTIKRKTDGQLRCRFIYDNEIRIILRYNAYELKVSSFDSSCADALRGFRDGLVTNATLCGNILYYIVRYCI